jgi:hypothetical protein
MLENIDIQIFAATNKNKLFHSKTDAITMRTNLQRTVKSPKDLTYTQARFEPMILCADGGDDDHYQAAATTCLHKSNCGGLSGREQGCQIFLDTIYQNGKKYTKLPLNYQMAIKCTR